MLRQISITAALLASFACGCGEGSGGDDRDAGVEADAAALPDGAVAEPVPRAPGSVVAGSGRLTGTRFVLEATLGTPTAPAQLQHDDTSLQVESPIR